MPGGGSKAENAEEETISSRPRNADRAEITVSITDEDFMNGSGLQTGALRCELLKDNNWAGLRNF